MMFKDSLKDIVRVITNWGVPIILAIAVALGIFLIVRFVDIAISIIVVTILTAMMLLLEVKTFNQSHKSWWCVN